MEGKNIPSSGPKPNGLLVCPYMSASGAEGERVLPENLNENAETDSHPPGFKPMRMEQELRPGRSIMLPLPRERRHMRVE